MEIRSQGLLVVPAFSYQTGKTSQTLLMFSKPEIRMGHLGLLSLYSQSENSVPAPPPLVAFSGLCLSGPAWGEHKTLCLS